MSILWIFGDSFASARNKNFPAGPPDYQWSLQLAKKLNCDEVKIEALPGVSNEWIFKQIKDNESTINMRSDKIVVITTASDRLWLIKDQPSLANIHMTNLKKLITRSQYKAIESYLVEFGNMHEELSVQRYEQFLLWLNSLPYMKCILPGFDATSYHNIVNGNLNTLCSIDEAEWISTDSKYKYMRKTSTLDDFRINHLSESNHNVLAEKIYQYFVTGKPVDLSTGFATNLY